MPSADFGVGHGLSALVRGELCERKRTHAAAQGAILLVIGFH
jgi:hypothetical protein